MAWESSCPRRELSQESGQVMVSSLWVGSLQKSDICRLRAVRKCFPGQEWCVPVHRRGPDNDQEYLFASCQHRQSFIASPTGHQPSK